MACAPARSLPAFLALLVALALMAIGQDAPEIHSAAVALVCLIRGRHLAPTVLAEIQALNLAVGHLAITFTLGPADWAHCPPGCGRTRPMACRAPREQRRPRPSHPRGCRARCARGNSRHRLEPRRS